LVNMYFNLCHKKAVKNNSLNIGMGDGLGNYNNYTNSNTSYLDNHNNY